MVHINTIQHNYTSFWTIQILHKPFNCIMHKSMLKNSFYLFALFILLFIIPQSTVVFVQAGCRAPNGLPMCCRGRQSICSSYVHAHRRNESQLPRANSHYSSMSLTKKLGLEACFCDEHCTKTKDCCPDYRKLCHKPAIDCTVSDWGPWTQCDRQCGRGVSVRQRQVVQQAMNGGRHCPVLEESKTCDGQQCSFRRVGRSGLLAGPYMRQARAEVAYLLPTRGDVRAMTRRWNMRWDVRRKLYLGRLIKQNKTEPIDPDPYCVVYEITYTNPSCETQTMLWQLNRNSMDPRLSRPQSTRFYDYHPNVAKDVFSFNRNPYLNRRRRSTLYGDSSNLYSTSAQSRGSTSWTRAWLTHASLLVQGQQICVVCYPGLMWEDAGFRCSGTGVLNVETRWRALGTLDCHGRFRMVRLPQRACTCGNGIASFNFA